MDIKITCPLGSDCEEKKDGKTTRCAWYILIRGKDPQSEKEVDEWGCAIGFLPMLLIEGAQQTRGVQAATESFRNEMVKQNNSFGQLLQMASEVAQMAQIENKGGQ